LIAAAYAEFDNAATTAAGNSFFYKRDHAR
jgi:hypothetical protein